MEQLTKMINRNKEQAIIRAYERDAKFTCLICDEPNLSAATVRMFAWVRMNDGVESHIGYFPKVVDGTVTYHPHAFIVCSEDCRKQYVKHSHFYKTLMEGIELPERLFDAERLAKRNFVTLKTLRNESNEAIVDALKDLVDSPKGFYIEGVAGAGKTSLAAALAFEYRKRELYVKFVSFSELRSALMSNYDVERTLAKLTYRYNKERWDVVILDDVESQFPGAYGQERMRVLFDGWYNNNTKLVITSNEAAEKVGKAIADRVLSRMNEMMNIIVMPELDYRKQTQAVTA
jgi:DNA replication protein DnaC